jgi:hypothetical protein
MAVTDQYHIIKNSKPPNVATCQLCENADAEIFQVDGDYCLECWQEKTHTSV